jgi:recombinational DNA repair ATPase RecF
VRISRVEIQNFRSVQSLDVELPQVSALVGPNSAGKSNVLAAIHRVLQDWVTVRTFDEDDVYGHDSTRDIHIALTFAPPVQYQKFAHSSPSPVAKIMVQYTRYKTGGARRLESRCLSATFRPSKFGTDHGMVRTRLQADQ